MKDDNLVFRLFLDSDESRNGVEISGFNNHPVEKRDPEILVLSGNHDLGYADTI